MSEIRVLKSKFLPRGTAMVSPDLFQPLSDNPEQATNRQEQLLAKLVETSEIMRPAPHKLAQPSRQPKAHPPYCGCEVK